MPKGIFETAEQATRNPSPETLRALYRQVDASNVARHETSLEIIQDINRIYRANNEMSAQTMTEAANLSGALEKT